MRTGTAPAALWAPMRTEADLRAWVIEAMPGDVVEYHLGFLARDRHLSPENRRISRVADAALGLSDKKLVHLVQKRVGRGRFSYLAVRRAR